MVILVDLYIFELEFYYIMVITKNNYYIKFYKLFLNLEITKSNYLPYGPTDRLYGTQKK